MRACEQVENGDLNWILPGKLVAFSGPAVRGNEIPGYRLYTPEDYWDYYRKKGVSGIVRLNKKVGGKGRTGVDGWSRQPCTYHLGMSGLVRQNNQTKVDGR